MILTPIQLPQPYSYLLTQPLLTIAIEHYYGAAPMIKLVAENLNLHNNLYYRTIIMMLKNRIIAERAGIVMNFNELPHPLIKQILNTNIPFGRLLYEAHVPIISQYQNYFALRHGCNRINYGRTNTILRADNHHWLARVIEILA